MQINCKGNLISVSSPIVMGILNITPDSFFDGGKYESQNEIIKRTELILSEGGQIIDIGAYSSRPGAKNITIEEEIKRVDNALSVIKKHFPEVCISLDTFRSEVVEFAVKNYGIDIVNDIYSGKASKNMFEIISKNNLVYIMMHMQGSPQNMQNNPNYNDVVLDIINFFSERIKKATLLGINDIIIDPGFGFGKTIEHNYEIINRLNEFSILNLPLLIGVSRKSMIYKLLNTTAENSLPGTIALNAICLQKGANILRVHDVKEAVEVVKIVQKTNE